MSFFVADNPCVVSLNGSFLLVKQGSTPTIDFMVAVNSDGVTELHTSVKKHLMFSFTNNELTTMFLPLPHVDPSNFQHYSCKLPPMDSSWAGNYTLSFNGLHIVSKCVSCKHFLIYRSWLWTGCSIIACRSWKLTALEQLIN